MKFELFKGLILVPAVFEYGAAKVETLALIDTGSGGSAVDIDLVKFDFSRQTKAKELVGIGGTQEVAIQDVESVAFCGVKTKQFPVEFGDIATVYGFKAVIGSDLLDFLGVCIDYKRREIGVDVR